VAFFFLFLSSLSQSQLNHAAIMKKGIKLNMVLNLDREIIIKLNEEQLGTIEGGQGANQTGQTQSSCPAFSCNPAECRGPLTAQ
jgi:hypothetical protein